MKLIVDTSVIVEIDRQNKDVVRLLQKLVQDGEELIISTVTVSEILTGSYLMKDVKKTIITAKEILNQFSWVELTGEVAEKTAQLMAYLISEKQMIEYPDIVIAASFLTSSSDYLLTLNKKHFLLFPQLKNRVFSPEEFAKK